MDKHTQQISRELDLREEHVENVICLLDEGNTIPFIARYRKEQHGTMDDQLIRTLSDRLSYLRSLDKRKEEVTASIEQQGKMTEELRTAVEAAQTLAEVEDVYRPYKQKRRTRATMAREKGLAPLADILFAQELRSGTVEKLAEDYVNPELGVSSVEEAIAGASDIIAEQISDDADIRRELKNLFRSSGVLVSAATGEEDSVYRMYYAFRQRISQLKGYQILAVNRGEKEKLLKISLEVEEKSALSVIKRRVIHPISISNAFVAAAAEDAWSRLIFPSVEREIRSELTDTASEQAIHTFGLNLRPLLLQPPVKDRVTMGFDPAYRTGCKIAVVDGTGKVLDTTVVYPTPPQSRQEEAKRILTAMIRKYGVTAISIGNGTASRESEIFVADMLQSLPGVEYMVVSEAGASVYSASKLAAQEFPQYDLTLRSAISIARRLQDPLAELVKIEPKSIGVGQYQHDMPEARLNETLTGVVEDCVNAVGADLNTASAPLLTRISGLTAATAANIVAFREENGPFRSRTELKKVPKIGPRAFEQCAGFLRIPGGKNLLDNTGVHPESYAAAEKLLELCGCTKEDVAARRVPDLRERVKAVGITKAAQYCGIGEPTVNDIITELLKPGRDPRDELPRPVLRTDVMDIRDLKPGMKLKGTVRNVVDFGAFVDIGVHKDGLVHVSRLSERRVQHPSEIVRVGDVVEVTVVEAEEKTGRITLSMREE